MSDKIEPPVVVAQPVYTSPEIIRLPDKFLQQPMEMTCPVCRSHVRTSTKETCNPICCVIFGAWALCCCQDVEHKCPQCNALLGKYSAT